LKRDPPARKLAILDVDRLSSVKNDGELGTLGSDFVGVPLTTSLGHRIDLGDINDRPGAVTWVWTRVENVDLIGIGRSDLLRIGAADEDAAVAVASTQNSTRSSKSV